MFPPLFSTAPSGERDRILVAVQSARQIQMRVIALILKMKTQGRKIQIDSRF
jgi:phosphoheptose isomerase